MVQIKCLSNGLYSLKNSHIPFGMGFQTNDRGFNCLPSIKKWKPKNYFQSVDQLNISQWHGKWSCSVFVWWMWKRFCGWSQVGVASPFECTHCGEKGNGRQKFLNHMRKHSTQKKVDKCAECQFETQKPGNLKRHMQIHNKVHTMKKSKFFKRCEPCGKEFDRKYNFDRHVKVHLKDPPQVFDCTQCEEKFSRKFTWCDTRIMSTLTIFIQISDLEHLRRWRKWKR